VGRLLPGCTDQPNTSCWKHRHDRQRGEWLELLQAEGLGLDVFRCRRPPLPASGLRFAVEGFAGGGEVDTCSNLGRVGAPQQLLDGHHVHLMGTLGITPGPWACGQPAGPEAIAAAWGSCRADHPPAG